MPSVEAGYTIAEKVFAAHAGTANGEPLRAGDICVARVDAALGTDGSAPMAIDYLETTGVGALHDPDSMVFAMDHYAPPASARSHALQDRVRAFVAEHGGTLYEVGQGIGHQLMVERGHVSAGALACGADSHSVTYGALNAIAVGVGSSDLAAIMATGALWFFVPHTIRIDMTGGLKAGVSAKDAALWMTGTFGGDGAAYQALEFGGAGLVALDMSDRFVLANMVAECGAKCGVFEHDAVTAAYLAEHGAKPGTPTTPDADASYARRVALDLSALVPLVALPHLPKNVMPVAEAEPLPVDMVYLGTCTGGRIKDFHEALAVLRDGGGPARGVEVYVTPASDTVYDALLADGTAAAFAELGARMMTPGCGACCGTCGAIPGDGVRVISTANRNFKGRMGNAKAEIVLASPMTCAASACTGRITDPRALVAKAAAEAAARAAA